MKHGANLLLNVMKKIGNDINSVMIGEVQNYDSNTNMAEIVPLHTVPETGEEYQPLVSVPIGFFNIGGYSINVQPKVGDRFILLFSDYDIENLLIDGNKNNKTKRTHALEDCIALPLNINFLNESNNPTQDLVIGKDGTRTKIIFKEDGKLEVNSEDDTTIISYGKLDIEADKDVTLNSKGKLNVTVSSDATINSSGKLNVTSNGDVTLNASGNATLNGGNIYLGSGASHKVALADKIKEVFDAHTHNITQGATTTEKPNTQFPDGSSSVFTK